MVLKKASWPEKTEKLNTGGKLKCRQMSYSEAPKPAIIRISKLKTIRHRLSRIPKQK
jgi:hypothetical protein